MKYQTLAETPIKYHRFIWYVFLPIRFLAAMWAVVYVLANIQNYYVWQSAILVTFDVVEIVLLITAFIGFFKWSRIAYYAMIAYCVSDICISVFALMNNLVLGCSVMRSIGALCGSATIAIINIVYYKNRKALFESEHRASGEQYIKEKEVQKCQTKMPFIDVSFCRFCGNALREESIYCDKCGARIR